jgi:O-antigen ligase
MMPRLLALNIFLFLITILISVQEKSGMLKHFVITNPIFKILTAYFIITLISLFFGINFREGFYETVKVFDFTILVAICSIILSNTKSWPEKLTKFAIIAVFISLVIGYFQYLSYVAGNNKEFLADGRQIIYSVKGLMGHKNHYASFLMLMMPFLGFGILKLKKSWKVLSVIGLTFVLIMIVLLQTRAVWLGIIFQLITLVIVIRIFYQKLNISKELINLGLAAGFVVLAAGFYKVITNAKQADTPIFNQAKSIFQPNDGYNKFRLKIWEITSVMISERPFTGVGAGNWKLKASEKFGESGFDKSRITWLSPHNDFLWIFAEKGIFGILLFLGMFAFVFFVALKLIQGESDKGDKTMTLSFAIGLVGYLVVSFFDFPYEEITHQTLLAIFIAGIISMDDRPKTLPESFKINRKIVKVPVLLFLIFGIIYGFAANLQEMHIRKARIALQRSNWKELLKESLLAESFCRNLDS